ncbi:uncharacterized protein THITE_2120656 [Thermothielavioides terrestris NRRL 8126]|uniref:Uncharacterized protein n=1 Tax=Thermothielavioides terrestris (strain ATCC 38088 / NRRL 8126) TaxID=578455 RepID=G2RD57_THETT|nr:uncharacterized protein THITE_2120656 [Thermothielavioides terrestris NRRL 8126]AEO69892.1 hypothetical protein THITE_2120656 [Thermothielavioides terrestris NRRL 8126]
MDDEGTEPCWSWPYWKFGLKRDDLFNTLHDRYNTVPSPILDPEAFHHDVYEISHQADSVDELHRLLQARKQQRLRELNETLESASFEIIANPTLIGTEQWQHAVQLFRTRSLDSLVRLFASYLPSDHPWHKPAHSASTSEAGSSVGSLTDSHSTLFDEAESPVMTDEPLEYAPYRKQLLPPSPRSMTMCSDSSVASPIDEDDGPHHFDGFGPATPFRTLSFSESEPDCCDMPESHAPGNCELASRCTDSQPAVATVPETVADGVDNETVAAKQPGSRDGAAVLPPSSSVDVSDCETLTPTPQPEARPAALFEDTKDTKPATPNRRYRSLSPSRPHPLSERDLDEVLSAHRDPRNAQRSRLARRERECSPAVQRRRRRRSPVEPATRIQKPAPEVARSRPRSRRWAVDS